MTQSNLSVETEVDHSDATSTMENPLSPSVVRVQRSTSSLALAKHKLITEKNPHDDSVHLQVGRIVDAKITSNAKLILPGTAKGERLLERIEDALEKRTTAEVDHNHVIFDELTPELAMQSLLSHVQLDPDGGLINLKNDAGQEGQQISKLDCLHKGHVELAMAGVFIATFLANVGFISAQSLATLFSYGIHVDPPILTDQFHMLMKRIAPADPDDYGLPFDSYKMSAITVAVVELVMLIYMLSQLLWDIFGAMRAENPTKKYLALAKAFWTDLPFVSSISALRPLGHVHPNMVIKHSRQRIVHDQCARAMLEQLFHMPEDSDTDTELAVQAGKVAVDCRRRAVSARVVESSSSRELEGVSPNRELVPSHAELRDIAIEMVKARPSQAWMVLRRELQKIPAAEQEQLASEWELNLNVPKNHYRLSFVVTLDWISFWLVRAAAYLVGFAALSVKFCQGAQHLLDPRATCFGKLLLLFALWNQIISIMAVNDLLNWRVQVFMFGGTDAVVTLEERYIISSYMGKLMQAVWENQSLSILQKVAISLKLDDDDLQQLVVEEDSDIKHSVSTAVRRHMEKVGAPVPLDQRMAKWARGWVVPSSAQDGYCLMGKKTTSSGCRNMLSCASDDVRSDDDLLVLP